MEAESTIFQTFENKGHPTAAVTDFLLIKNAADKSGPDIASVSLDSSTSSLHPQKCVDEVSLLGDIRPYCKANAGPGMK